MGSCVSVHQNSPGSVMKMVSFKSKSDKLVIPESPKKENSVPSAAANGGHPVKSLWSFVSSNKSFGSKEETFYDSQPWLESDCDDDFHSVNGDFTPSRGNTPKHCFSGGIPRLNNPLFDDKPSSSVPNPAPTQKRKKLVELFKDSIREERQDSDDQEDYSGNQSETSKKMEAKATTTIVGLPPKSSQGTPYVSGANSSACSSDWNANEDSVAEKEKPLKSGQCCLPGLVSCSGSFSDRKKKMMSPAIAVK